MLLERFSLVSTTQCEDCLPRRVLNLGISALQYNRPVLSERQQINNDSKQPFLSHQQGLYALYLGISSYRTVLVLVRVLLLHVDYQVSDALRAGPRPSRGATLTSQSIWSRTRTRSLSDQIRCHPNAPRSSSIPSVEAQIRAQRIAPEASLIWSALALDISFRRARFPIAGHRRLLLAALPLSLPQL